MLTEAYYCGTAAIRWGREHGYTWCRASAARHGWEARSVAMLVRDDIAWHNIEHLRQPWWWGKNPRRLRRRKPRRILKLQTQRHRDRYASGHNVPGGPAGAVPRTGGKNGPGWHEGAEADRDLLDKGFIIGGDPNARPDEIRHHITNPVGAHYAPTGAAGGVMYPHRWRHVRTETIPNHLVPGHGWGVVRLTER